MLSRLPRCQLIPRLGPISGDEIKMLTVCSHILCPSSCVVRLRGAEAASPTEITSLSVVQ